MFTTNATTWLESISFPPVVFDGVGIVDDFLDGLQQQMEALMSQSRDLSKDIIKRGAARLNAFNGFTSRGGVISSQEVMSVSKDLSKDTLTCNTAKLNVLNGYTLISPSQEVIIAQTLTGATDE